MAISRPPNSTMTNEVSVFLASLKSVSSAKPCRTSVRIKSPIAKGSYLRCYRAAQQTSAEHRDGKAGPGHHRCIHRRVAARHLWGIPDHDGRLCAYRTAIPNTLEDRADDFAMLIKVYRAAVEGEARYSPAEVAAVEGGGGPNHGPSRSGPHLHFDCRAVQSQHAYERSALHSPDERLLEEMGEPLGRCCAMVCVLQFLPGSQILAGNASDGGRDQRPHLELAGAPGCRVKPLSETRSGCSFW